MARSFPEQITDRSNGENTDPRPRQQKRSHKLARGAHRQGQAILQG